MLHGLHQRWIAILFAVGIIFSFGMANQMVQSRTICDTATVSLGLNSVKVALALAVMTSMVIFGGVQRISRFSAIVVPVMAVGYLGLSAYILITNITQIPAMLALIVKSAFGLEQAGGAMVGVAVMQGVKRGLFSNEAGEGSTPHAAATATVSHPVKQGLLQSMGVFVDTLLICTCTAFVIMLSGLYANGEDGSILTGSAMQFHLGALGRWYLTIIIFLFAFSSIIGNYYYGESCMHFITPRRWPLRTYRVVSTATVFIGGTITLQQAWSMIDLMMAFIVVLNLYALLRLAKYAYRLKNDYFRQRREGRNPTFHRSTLPEIANELECWEE